MITLHGFAASDYYNLVKRVLLYKKVPFQENLIYSGGDKWPAGKTASESVLAEERQVLNRLNRGG